MLKELSSESSFSFNLFPNNVIDSSYTLFCGQSIHLRKNTSESDLKFLSQTDRLKNACYFLIEDDIISVLLTLIFVMIGVHQNHSVVLGYPHILTNTENVHLNILNFF